MEKLLKELERRYAELRELESHENYPWVDEIPGYRFCTEEIDRLETELAERGCFE